jgi:hypothetical protein
VGSRRDLEETDPARRRSGAHGEGRNEPFSLLKRAEKREQICGDGRNDAQARRARAQRENASRRATPDDIAVADGEQG